MYELGVQLQAGLHTPTGNVCIEVRGKRLAELQHGRIDEGILEDNSLLVDLNFSRSI